MESNSLHTSALLLLVLLAEVTLLNQLHFVCLFVFVVFGFGFTGIHFQRFKYFPMVLFLDIPEVIYIHFSRKHYRD